MEQKLLQHFELHLQVEAIVLEHDIIDYKAAVLDKLISRNLDLELEFIHTRNAIIEVDKYIKSVKVNVL